MMLLTQNGGKIRELFFFNNFHKSIFTSSKFTRNSVKLILSFITTIGTHLDACRVNPAWCKDDKAFFTIPKERIS